jgi:hypothetical protein
MLAFHFDLRQSVFGNTDMLNHPDEPVILRFFARYCPRKLRPLVNGLLGLIGADFCLGPETVDIVGSLFDRKEAGRRKRCAKE